MREMKMQADAEAVRATRARNVDVFVWPEQVWSLEYIHEETSEWARCIQTTNAPDHARNSTDVNLTLAEREELECGQVLMMVLTLALQRGIDTDRALLRALAKIDATSARKRAAAAITAA